MKLHEYQAKELLRSLGAVVPRGGVAYKASEVADAVAAVPGPLWVVKAQIHAGGRGKGAFLEGARTGSGGVAVVKSAAEAEAAARAMLGSRLATIQTGPEGQRVSRVWIEEGSSIEREMYLSLLLDRVRARTVIVAAAEGGMGIEELAAKSPEKILRIVLDPAVGWSPWIGRRMAERLGLEGAQVRDFSRLLKSLVEGFEAWDASMIEINPLAIVKGGAVMALDAKIQIDDSALFRRPELAALEDPGESAPEEREAQEHDLSYVKLDGDIGCMVNGAGLAMATMDMISLSGGSPANFLDVGGGADAEKVEAAFRIILRDSAVKAVLVNIFGGIMRCDVIAEGVVRAARGLGLQVPLVVRLEGTRVAEGRAILEQSGLEVVAARDLADAASAVVAAARGARGR